MSRGPVAAGERGRRWEPCRALVVGGGISGLSAAYGLAQAIGARDGGNDLRLLEASDRLGGQVRTYADDGLLLEGGPDSLVAQKPAGVALCRELGLGDEIIAPQAAAAPMRLLHGKRLVDLPAGFLMLAPTRLAPLLHSPLFSWRGKARMAIEPFVPRRADPTGDESLRSFVVRRFGREAFERAAEPIVGSLYLADADRLSLRLSMPRFLELESRHGSVVLGMRRMRKRAGAGDPRGPHGSAGRPGVVSLRRGMSSLVERLVERLPAGATVTGATVRGIAFDPAISRWRVEVEGGAGRLAEVVVLACPAHAAARLLRALDRGLAERFEQPSYASCATVNLVYPRDAIGATLDYYGFFVPRTAGSEVVACNVSSRKFVGRAPDEFVVLRAFVGGATRPGALRSDDGELVRRVHGFLAELLDIRRAPRYTRVHRAPLAMPQFAVGHAEHLSATRERLSRHPGLFVCGTSDGVVGLPDCIVSGKRAASAAAALLQARARGLEAAS
jgi:oxygen-dependent protoporphyrinogen oxidase